MMKSSSFLIPLNKPLWGREEEKAAISALRGGIGVGDLDFSAALSEEIKRILNVNYVLPTSSGTAALELACACTLKRGSEVIMPSFTFSSCANAVLLVGAKPVFAEISANTYNLNPKDVVNRITKKTRAIMVVHYAGMAAEMDKLYKIAKKYKLYVIEDAAHSLGAKFKSRHLGTIGDIGCFSMHGTKNLASGEGGFFVTNDKNFSKVAEIIREKGTNRSSFIRGERKKYSWINVGRSLVLSDILSAIALEQVKKLEKISTMRKKNALYLLGKLKKLSDKVILPIVPNYADPNWHIFAIRVPKGARNNIIKGFRSYGIEAAFHYLPLHTSPMGEKLGYKKGNLPVTEEVAATLIRLPMYPSLKKSELNYMSEVLQKLI